MHKYVRVVKISQLLLVERMSGYRVPLRDHISIPYPYPQEVGLFGQKENHHTLSPRE